MRAISTFSLEAGTSTFWCRACSALRTLVSISATGSVNLIVCFSSRHPFAPHSAENLQRLPYHLLQPCNPERDSLCLPLLSRARHLLSPLVILSETFFVSRRISRSTNPEALPRRLRHSRNLPQQRQLPEAHPAQAKLPQIRARSPAALAAIVLARRKLRLLYAALGLLSAVLNPLCHCCHV